jgi:hypothetical protein
MERVALRVLRMGRVGVRTRMGRLFTRARSAFEGCGGLTRARREVEENSAVRYESYMTS